MLSLVRKALSVVENSLANVNGALHYSYKMIKEYEETLNELWEDWKKTQNDLLDMHSEKIDMCKKYLRSLEQCYYVLHTSFETTLKHVVYRENLFILIKK